MWPSIAGNRREGSIATLFQQSKQRYTNILKQGFLARVAVFAEGALWPMAERVLWHVKGLRAALGWCHVG
jgi:hypothetical protein